MRIKILGKWYDISYIKAEDDAPRRYVTSDNIIEDIEINGRHLAHLNNEVSKSEAVEPQDNKPTEKLVRKIPLDQKGNRSFKVGDEVMTICPNGSIFRGEIAEIYGVELCHLVTPNGKFNLIDVPLSKLVDDSDDADPNYTAAQIRKMQAEYWKEKAQRQADSKLSKEIDWEQRTYDVAAQLYVRQLTLSEQACVDAAKKLIDTYRKETKL